MGEPQPLQTDRPAVHRGRRTPPRWTPLETTCWPPERSTCCAPGSDLADKRSGAAEDARDQRGDLGITVRDRNPVR